MAMEMTSMGDGSSSTHMNFPRRASQIEKLTLENTEAKDYLSKLCQSLVKNGIPAHRLEKYMSKSSKLLLKNRGTYHYIPGLMYMEYEGGDRRVITCREGGVDLGNLFQIHEININLIESGNPLNSHNVNRAVRALGELDHRGPPRMPLMVYKFLFTLVQCILYFVSGVCMSYLGYQASVREALYAGMFCVPVVLVQTGWVKRRLRSHEVALVEVAYVFLLTVLVQLVSLKQKLCFPAMTLAPLAWILPSYDFVASGLEILVGTHVSGTARLVHAVVRTLAIEFGIVLGGSMYGIFHKDYTTPIACPAQELPPWWRVLIVLVFTPCLIAFQYTAALEDFIGRLKWQNKKLLVHMAISFIISVLSFVVYNAAYISFPAGRAVPNFLASIVIGFCGHLYRRLHYGPSATVMLSALSLQVPSSLATTADLGAGLVTATELLWGRGNGTMIGKSFSGDVDIVDPATYMFHMIGTMIMNTLGVALGLLAGFWVAQIVYRAKEWYLRGRKWTEIDWDLLDF